MKQLQCANTAAMIRRLRYDLGLTQKELAEAVRVHPSAVKQWETRRCMPSPEHYKQLRHFFGSRLANGDDYLRKAWERDEQTRLLQTKTAGENTITAGDTD